MSEQASFRAVDMLVDWRENNHLLTEREMATFEEAYYQIEAYRGTAYLDIQTAIAMSAILELSATRANVLELQTKPEEEPQTVFLVTKYDTRDGKMLA